MAVSGENQQTAFVGNADAYERSHRAEEIHAAPSNGDAVKCKPGGRRSLRMVVVDDRFGRGLLTTAELGSPRTVVYDRDGDRVNRRIDSTKGSAARRGA
jgi:hypothetical protein